MCIKLMRSTAQVNVSAQRINEPCNSSLMRAVKDPLGGSCDGGVACVGGMFNQIQLPDFARWLAQSVSLEIFACMAVQQAD
jgi:hypothetical protein